MCLFTKNSFRSHYRKYRKKKRKNEEIIRFDSHENRFHGGFHLVRSIED